MWNEITVVWVLLVHVCIYIYIHMNICTYMIRMEKIPYNWYVPYDIWLHNSTYTNIYIYMCVCVHIVTNMLSLAPSIPSTPWTSPASRTCPASDAKTKALTPWDFFTTSHGLKWFFPKKKMKIIEKNRYNQLKSRQLPKKKTSTFSIEKLSHPCIILGIYNTIYTSKKYHVNHLRNHWLGQL